MLLTMLSLGDFQESCFVTPIAQLCLSALLAGYAIICLLAHTKGAAGCAACSSFSKEPSAQFLPY